MIKVEIKGLDKLKRELQEAQRALAGLDGKLASLQFNPDDTNDVQRAIRQMEQTIDGKVSSYRNNPMVQEIVTGMKQRLREEILRRAKTAQ